MHEYFQKIFTVDALEKLEEKDKDSLTKKLHYVLFSEEFDHMYDSFADARDRARGINPMSIEYQNEVNEKRDSLLINNDCSPVHFCKMEVEALLVGRKTDFTDLMLTWLGRILTKTNVIKNSINQQSLYAPEINPNDATTWSDNMIKNLYKREVVAALWDLEEVKYTIEEFKQRLLEDAEFRKIRIPKKGMEKDDYDPSTN